MRAESERSRKQQGDPGRHFRWHDIWLESQMLYPPKKAIGVRSKDSIVDTWQLTIPFDTRYRGLSGMNQTSSVWSRGTKA